MFLQSVYDGSAGHSNVPLVAACTCSLVDHMTDFTGNVVVVQGAVTLLLGGATRFLRDPFTTSATVLPEVVTSFMGKRDLLMLALRIRVVASLQYGTFNI